MEDALSMLLRKTQAKSPALDDVVLDFIYQLLVLLQIPGNDTDASPALLRQSKCIVGCILSILGANLERLLAQSSTPPPLVVTAIACLGLCGIPICHIVYFAKWKAFRTEWMAMVLPTASIESCPSDSDEDDHDDDDGALILQADIDRHTNQMVRTLLPDPFGLKYMGDPPAWSDAGLAVVAHWLAVVPSLQSQPNTISSANLITIEPLAPHIETLLHHTAVAVKRGGLTMLTAILQASNPHVATPSSSSYLLSPNEKVPPQINATGLDQYARRHLDDNLQSLNSLFQAVLSSMVMLPDAADRAHALASWQRLVDMVAPTLR
ncbi:hypothetical protein DYB37_001291 [Aphanomyces astaci]|uniref:Uncharacterized protein n=1 Tax=Aphanomyces astaci TaxID=112090 RepID=A0A418E8W1_APHAT|nr:hypothetical protein DYB37_001291 [Aphanomyces astaci]